MHRVKRQRLRGKLVIQRVRAVEVDAGTWLHGDMRAGGGFSVELEA